MDTPLLLKAALLGLVEGLTEFIPVSSTGHLIVVADWLGYGDVTGREGVAKAFLVFIQLGAIFAVLWHYRVKFVSVARTLTTVPASRRLVFNLVVATLPAVAVGLPLDDWIEGRLLKPFPVAVALAVGGVLILLIERRYGRPGVGNADDVSTPKAIGVGCFQVLAILFPGVSRSGATIMGGLVLGLDRRAATEFSFFLAIPAMFGASLVTLYKARGVLAAADAPVFAIGFAVAFVSALVVIKALLAFVSRHSFAPFAWYRIAAGAALVALYWNAPSGF